MSSPSPQRAKHEEANNNDPMSDISYRLFKTTKSGRIANNHPDKETSSHHSSTSITDAALVSDLPSETLRWIKKRRSFLSDKKVVLSHHRERQLRHMFQSLDYKGEGKINLEELNEAVDYVGERSRNSKALEKFRDLHNIFSSMDDNNDGTIDFNEFINGMTGTTKSIFDQASPDDLERLFNCFIEFGELRKRERAVKQLEESLHGGTDNISVTSGSVSKVAESPKNSNSSNAKKEKHTKEHIENTTVKAPDLSLYQTFKSLFGAEENKKEHGMIDYKKAQEMSHKKAKHIDSIVSEFLTEQNGNAVENSLSNFYPLNINSVVSLPSEHNRPLDIKLKEQRKLQLEMHYYDNDAIAHYQRTAMSKARKKNSPLPSLLSPIHRVPSLESDINSVGSVSNHLASPFAPSSQIKKEVALKLNAKREAYDILRQTMNVNDNFSDSQNNNSVGGKISAASWISGMKNSHSLPALTSLQYKNKSNNSTNSHSHSSIRTSPSRQRPAQISRSSLLADTLSEMNNLPVLPDLQGRS